jgi:hypothetical protein
MNYKSIIVTALFSITLGLSSCGNKSGKPTSSSNSIEFMEIPIEGNVNSFGEKLEQRGYYCNGDDTLSNQIGYDGIYLNKTVMIVLTYDQGTRAINRVRTWFKKDMPSAASLLNEYTEKYGKCEMKAEYGNVYYTWKVDGGYIGVVTDNSSFLAIDYSNKELEY